jgi:cephalosporin-C deacetylase-like acetyl esterase
MKKKNLFKIMLFILACTAFLTTAHAQPQRVVTVLISPDHQDWKYKVGEEATFVIQALQYGNLIKNAVVDYEFGPEFFPDVVKKDQTLKDGKLTLKGTMKTPGFLRCRVVVKSNGREYEGLATAAFDPEKITPATEEPKDFDAFWNTAIEDARKTQLNPVLKLLPDRSTSTLNVYEASYQNGYSRMYGIVAIPKKAGRYPAILQVPGAGIRPYSGITGYGDNVITMEIGIHGISVTLPSEVYNNLASGALANYWGFNKNNRDTHYYKRVYTGCVRAVDFIYTLPEFNGTTVAVTGGSQGGALSIITAGLDARISYLAAYYPALCDYAGYLKKRAGGWPHYFRNAQPEKGEVETLAYFDVVNFARRVKVQGIYSWGFNDVTCPPTSMYAAYNIIPGEKTLHIYQDTGHWTYPEQGKLFSDWLLDKIK